MIRTVILDDDPHSQKAACQALAAYSDILIAGQFCTAAELEAYLQKNTADVIFLDIEIGGDFGFSVARQLRQQWPKLMIVFLTGHSSYAVDGYDFQPVNFLTKPINPQKLEQTVQQLRQHMQSQRSQRKAQLMFRLLQGYRIIDVRDICCIERKDRKNYLYLEKETLQISSYTMQELEQMLEEYGFFLCHQSFLINLYRTEKLADIRRQLYEAHLRGCNTPIPVSRNRYETLKTKLQGLGILLL